MKIFISLFLLSFNVCLFAQKGIDYINPKETFEQILELYQNNEHDKALELFDKFHINDSAYYGAMFIKTSILLDQEKYDETIELCNELLKLPNANPIEINTNKGLCYLRQEMFAEAISIYEELLKTYPKSEIINYNLGLAYSGTENYDKAIKAYQNAIVCNPYYAWPHYQLAFLCMHEGLVSQALLCYNTYLMLQPTSESSLDILVLANEMVSSKQDLEPKGITFSDDDKAFAEMDQVLKSYAALNKKYKTNNKITIPFVKQNHLLFEMLDDFDGNNGFWDRNYVKIYQQIHKDMQFNNLVYRMSLSTTNTKYSKIIRKNYKDSDKFLGYLADLLTTTIGSNNLPDSAGNKQYYYYGNGKLHALGKKDEDNWFDGYTYFFTEEGRPMSEGMMQHGEYEGAWEFHYNNGTLSAKINYKDGKQQDTMYNYTPLGKLDFVSNFDAGEHHGQYRGYFYNEALSSKITYVNGTMEGEAIYYFHLDEEHPMYVLNYKNNEINDTLKEYFSSGELSVKVNFVNGKKQGKETSYYPNGSIHKISNFLDNELSGNFKIYYRNGQILQEGQYLKDKPVGLWKEYYFDGTLESETNYNQSGELHGEYKEYARDGKLYSILIYSGDDIKKYTCYDKNGKIIASETKAKGEFDFKIYSPYGDLIGEGKYKLNGGKTGTWNYYNNFGYLVSTEKFDVKEETMSDKEYYPNGTLSSMTFYEDDKEQGYSFTNFVDGTLYTEEYYVDGNPERVSKEYYANGNISAEYYYKEGEYEGIQTYYAVNGKIIKKEFYQNGFLTWITLYDSVGTVTDSLNLINEKVHTRYYNNGQELSIKHFKHGYAHGRATWYYPDGQIELEGDLFFGKRNGEWKWYHQNGQLKTSILYTYGQANGKTQNFYSTGELRYEGQHYQDKLDGIFKRYAKNGNVIYSSNNVDGFIHDTVYYYSNEGELQMARIYRWGEIQSYSYEGADGKLLPFIELENGTGEFTTYYSNGNIARKSSFVSGELDGEYFVYHSNGQLAEESFFINSQQYKTEKTYFRNGKPKTVLNYINDEPDGEYISYHNNGNIRLKIYYICGIKHGMAEYYNEEGKLLKQLEYYNNEIIEAKYY